MNFLPSELENIINDYKMQIEISEKKEKLLKNYNEVIMVRYDEMVGIETTEIYNIESETIIEYVSDDKEKFLSYKKYCYHCENVIKENSFCDTEYEEEENMFIYSSFPRKNSISCQCKNKN